MDGLDNTFDLADINRIEKCEKTVRVYFKHAVDIDNGKYVYHINFGNTNQRAEVYTELKALWLGYYKCVEDKSQKIEQSLVSGKDGVATHESSAISNIEV